MSGPKVLPPPRLGVLLASDAPVGVVFRRGPSKVVRLVMWNRGSDEFEEGQVFKGRILIEQSDISPDGRHLLYFAMGGVAWAIPETGGAWTAISRLPSLTAIALWGQSDGGTRGGGGMFTSNHSFWIDADHNTVRVRDNRELRRVAYFKAPSRMERAGWTSKSNSGSPLHIRIFEKVLPDGWSLRKTEQWRKTDRYEVEHAKDGCLLRFPTWEWADWDRTRLK